MYLGNGEMLLLKRVKLMARALAPAAPSGSQAAGVPLVALTAWQALQQAKPQAGQRCLVNAAAGGVGHMAVQASVPAVAPI